MEHRLGHAEVGDQQPVVAGATGPALRSSRFCGLMSRCTEPVLVQHRQARAGLRDQRRSSRSGPSRAAVLEQVGERPLVGVRHHEVRRRRRPRRCRRPGRRGRSRPGAGSAPPRGTARGRRSAAPSSPRAPSRRRRSGARRRGRARRSRTRRRPRRSTRRRRPRLSGRDTSHSAARTIVTMSVRRVDLDPTSRSRRRRVTERRSTAARRDPAPGAADLRADAALSAGRRGGGPGRAAAGGHEDRQFAGRSKFTTWLHAVASNSARATYRSLKRRAAERPTDDLPLGAPTRARRA